MKGRSVKAVPTSAVPGITWPALPSSQGSSRLALMFQMEQSQWWSPETLQKWQFTQIHQLLAHAFATTRFYRERLQKAGFSPGTPVTPAVFTAIPLLQREDIQLHLTEMTSSSVPKDHGRLGYAESSGSTGKPVRVHSTSLSQFFWHGMTLRDHLWHGRDLFQKHAEIRVGVGSRTGKNWGSAVNVAFDSGPSLMLDIKEPVDRQVQWIREHRPAYLLTYPSNLQEMAGLCLERGIDFPGMLELRTFGETVTGELREICRQAWNLEIKDMYSAMEIGYLALQCPDHEHYHVMSDGVFLEVLDDAGAPCRPGQIGRVVVTDLHNFATPLIRYEILDYAEAGGPCPCGRGLPVLNRVMGRQRNMLRLPDGTRQWPSFSPRKWPHADRIRQVQIVQK
ncbi:MAG: phenylacetate--CoA ligase family protein, partial [Thermodesulfobacteriota bacterium]